jgi:hypothetical protein
MQIATTEPSTSEIYIANFIKVLCQENKKVNCINFSDIRNVTDKLLSTDPEIL